VGLGITILLVASEGPSEPPALGAGGCSGCPTTSPAWPEGDGKAMAEM